MFWKKKSKNKIIFGTPLVGEITADKNCRKDIPVTYTGLTPTEDIVLWVLKQRKAGIPCDQDAIINHIESKMAFISSKENFDELKDKVWSVLDYIAWDKQEQERWYLKLEIQEHKMLIERMKHNVKNEDIVGDI